MKKSLLMVAAATIVLTSCSNDEVISTPDKSVIGFDSYVSKTTRATDATTSNLMSINVYGYIGGATPVKNFDGTKVSRTSASAPWTYEPLQYWTAGKDYFFTAISSPVSEGNNHYSYSWAENLPVETAGFNGIGTIAFNNQAAAGNEDVIYAFATKTTPDPLTSDPGEVQFAFKHALSRIKFTFTNAMGSDAYFIKVYGLTVNNAAAQAELVLGTENPEWTGHTGTVVLTLRDNLFNPSNQTAGNADKVASGTKFIIPGTSTLNISFKVDLLLNGAVLATYSHIDQALPETVFQNGHSYNFVAEINPENINPDEQMYPIKFNVVDVDEWIESGDSEIEL